MHMSRGDSLMLEFDSWGTWLDDSGTGWSTNQTKWATAAASATKPNLVVLSYKGALWRFSMLISSSSSQALRSGRSLCFLREEDPSVRDDDARAGQGLPSGVLQVCRLPEALLRGWPLPADQLRHCVRAGHLRVDQTQQQQHGLAESVARDGGASLCLFPLALKGMNH